MTAHDRPGHGAHRAATPRLALAHRLLTGGRSAEAPVPTDADTRGDAEGRSECPSPLGVFARCPFPVRAGAGERHRRHDGPPRGRRAADQRRPSGARGELPTDGSPGQTAVRASVVTSAQMMNTEMAIEKIAHTGW